MTHVSNDECIRRNTALMPTSGSEVQDDNACPGAVGSRPCVSGGAVSLTKQVHERGPGGEEIL